MEFNKYLMIFMLLIYASVIIYIASIAITGNKTNVGMTSLREEYFKLRKDYIDQEQMQRTGGSLSLNKDEQIVNSYLMKLKQAEIDAARKPGGMFWPAVHFFQAKDHITQSPVFKIIKKMPKGAGLHLHLLNTGSIEYLVYNVTYDPLCYMRWDLTGQLHFHFFPVPPPESPDLSWKKCQYYRNLSNSTQEFDKMIFQSLTFTVDEPAKVYPTQEVVWNRFLALLTTIYGLITYEPVFYEYFAGALQILYEDNIQYVELREPIMTVYELNGKEHDAFWYISALQDINKEFVLSHQDFMGFKFINSGFRGQSKEMMASTINESISLRMKFPDFFAGLDLAADEDRLNPNIYYVDELLYPSQTGQDLPYFLHAGETNWYGTEVDLNILDALLVKAKRIGHGFAITKHPVFIELARQNDVPLEVNPISNQVLKLVDDLRNHPASSLMATGFPIVIGSDNPNMWGVTGLSYDFYEAFMGLGGTWADLRTLKKLALDSIKYSAMSGDEKQRTMEIWQAKWDIFLQEIIHEFNL